jgi:hypothetical protein
MDDVSNADGSSAFDAAEMATNPAVAASAMSKAQISLFGMKL